MKRASFIMTAFNVAHQLDKGNYFLLKRAAGSVRRSLKRIAGRLEKRLVDRKGMQR